MIMKKRSIKKITAFLMTVIFVANLMPLDSVSAMGSIIRSNCISYTALYENDDNEEKKSDETDTEAEKKVGGIDFLDIRYEVIYVDEEEEKEKSTTYNGSIESKQLIPNNTSEETSEDKSVTDDLDKTEDIIEGSQITETQTEEEIISELAAINRRDFNLIINSEKYDWLNNKYGYVIDFFVKRNNTTSLNEAVKLKYKIYKISGYNKKKGIGVSEDLLSEGAISIAENEEHSETVNYLFDCAGEYEVRLCNEQDEVIDKIIYCIEKKEKKIELTDSDINLKYGEKTDLSELIRILNLDGSIEITKQNPTHLYEFEINFVDEQDKKVLNIFSCDKDVCKDNGMCNYIEAVGVNDKSKGEALVRIKLKETGFVEESNEVELKVNIEKLKPEIKINTLDEAKAYDNLNIGIELVNEEKDITEEILKDKTFIEFSIDFIRYDFSTAQSVFDEIYDDKKYIDSRKLQKNKNGEYIIPITAEYFANMSLSSIYSIEAKLMYDEDTENGIYSPFEPVSSRKNICVKGSQIGLQTTLDKNGQFDYRSDYGKTANLTVTVEETESLDQDSVIEYQINSNNKKVIDIKENKKYTNTDNVIPLIVNGAGSACVSVDAVVINSNVYDFGAAKNSINVLNSSFKDEDIVITYESKNGTSIEFVCNEAATAIEQWKNYLREHDFWVNGIVYINLSDIGKQYYNKVCVQNGLSGAEGTIKQNKEILEYTIWTEHTERNADTSQAENGTRTFTMGMDTQAPVSNTFSYSEDYFEPTKTDKCQYYASDFVINGSFTDKLSGVYKIEYTTDYSDNTEAVVWTEAEIIDTDLSETKYKIVLQNGNYKAIAIRAYDKAGNVSDIKFLKNSKGEFINVIVDDTEPKISVEAYSNGNIYDGKNENWTNNAVKYDVTYDNGDTGIAGIYSCEYAYKTVLDYVNKDLTFDWKTLETISDDSKDYVSSLVIGMDKAENKNGYYYFQAVSKSGVKTSVPVEKRILLQQKMADKKPVIVTGVSENHNSEWYNKESGTPIISFAYPDYDNGSSSGEYEAPVILHYNLWVADEEGNVTELKNNATATKGVNKKEDFEDGKFKVTSDNLEGFKVNFGLDKTTGYAKDGIYTLEYWISDKASNESKKEKLSYKIDCHEPTELMVKIADIDMTVDSEENILYQSFYQKAVSGSASAEYGISGEGSLKILKAKKIGEWSSNTSFEDGKSFEIAANNRCFIYVEATDKAGNKAKGWTRGVVVDDMAPVGNDGLELVLEPKGANEHGFHNKDIEVEISIKDAPDSDDCAALMDVRSSIGKDGNDTVSGKELFSFTKELPTNEELSSAQSFSTIQVINAKENESNNAYIDVTAVDRSNNLKTSTQVLKIDVTKPQIDITFDNNDAINESYFNSTRVATIHVNELNFNPEYVNIEVTKDGLAYEVNLSEWTSTENEHYVSIAFAEDGDYTLSVSCKDLADNEADKVNTEAFTIDKTLPVADIRLEGNVSNEIYYNSQVKAAITIKEHNFDEKDFVLKLADDNAILKTGEWTHKGDVHTTWAVFDNDGNYNLICEYTDKAGNSLSSFVEKTFVIDTVLPGISISGVTDGSANSGEVIPVVTISDLNTSQTSTNISLKTGIGEVVEIEKSVSFLENENQKNYVYTLTDITSKEDNIYYLTVNTKDMAGNENLLSYRFSLNRNGSTYDINDFKKLKENYYNSYFTMEDLVIYEMNIDKVEDFNIYISRNGEMLSGKQIVLESDINALVKNKQVAYSTEISGNENTGYTYKYTIYKENFANEGTYRMGIYSKDKAGNEVNNSLEVNGEDISFVIDATQPKVVIEGIESGKIYDTTEQTVNVMVSDNFKLNEAEFVLVNADGDELQSWDYYEFAKNEGDVVTLTIPQYNEEVSLLFRAKDAAGNEILTLPDSKTAVSDVLITTDKWVQMVNKPEKSPVPVIIIFIMAGAFIIQAGMVYASTKKTKITKK